MTTRWIHRTKHQMKNKHVVQFVAAVLIAAPLTGAAQSQPELGGWVNSHMKYERGQGSKFTSREVSMDLFGSFLSPERNIEHLFDTNIRHGKWGGGVGVNYFFTRELGISGDINIPDNGGSFIDSVGGNLLARLPIESVGVAPYIFGGGGRGTDPTWEWFGDAGVGVEVRLSPVTGVFVDGRYMWADVSSDKLLLRAGIRVVF